ncbi:hypothetical protein EVAR_75497_1 [Eumeta japonica]|uniref:Uncharacterized protein n=1 Tax=Eumeta variegata TaxID=151549 RepID=A0A4C1TLJ1_EUMVA|nr:hypothetical protein EVAR_75497_1 [Eumeta japonica]
MFQWLTPSTISLPYTWDTVGIGLDILFLSTYAGTALTTPLEMRMFMGGVDHLLFGGSHAPLARRFSGRDHSQRRLNTTDKSAAVNQARRWKCPAITARRPGRELLTGNLSFIKEISAS